MEEAGGPAPADPETKNEQKEPEKRPARSPKRLLSKTVSRMDNFGMDRKHRGRMFSKTSTVSSSSIKTTQTDMGWRSPVHELRVSHTCGRDRYYKSVAEPGGISVPGPGSYNSKSAPVKGLFGRFSTAKPKSDVEWTIYRARNIPGPADYPAPTLPGPGGGKFNTSKAKSDVEWMIYRAREIPGPARYAPPKLAEPSGGRFSLGKPKSDVEWRIYNAKQIPGPKYKMRKLSIGPSFKMKGKVTRGNHQTSLADAIQFEHTTLPVSPTQCRSDPSCGPQISSMQRSSPAYSFGKSGRPQTVPDFSCSALFPPKPGPKSQGRLARSGKRALAAPRFRTDFERYFGYDPTHATETAHARRKGVRSRPATREALSRQEKQRKIIEERVQRIANGVHSPGPGEYTLPPPPLVSPAMKFLVD